MARSGLRAQDGFTLIEILVVILILGILAAIAIPRFLGQSERAKDAKAMSLARELSTHAEACRTEADAWSECDSAAEVTARTSLKWGTGAGEVQVLIKPYGLDAIVFSATSDTGTVFALVHQQGDQQLEKICYVPAGAYPTGACHQGGALPGFGRW